MMTILSIVLGIITLALIAGLLSGFIWLVDNHGDILGYSVIVVILLIVSWAIGNEILSKILIMFNK